MEYNYEALFYTDNNFRIAFQKLRNEIIQKSTEYDLDALIESSEHLSADLLDLQEFRDWVAEPIKELERLFVIERNKLIDSNTHFSGCPLDVYSSNYDKRLKLYLDTYEDAKEDDFIFDEKMEINRTDDNLEMEVSGYKIFFDIRFINDPILLRKINFSIDAKFEFLNEKLSRLKEKKLSVKSNLSWDGLQTGSSELKLIEEENINPYPTLFLSFDVYKCFEEYTKKHIIDFHSDFSYLKKRLENHKLIYYHRDNDFINFIFNDMQLIKKNEYDSYFTKYDSKFKSLNKSASTQRENNFNNVFECLI
jgi:hypothetical protein